MYSRFVCKRREAGYIIVEGDIFVVRGKKVEDLASMTDFSQEEAVDRFQHILKKMGIESALKKKGIKKAQTVKIGRIEFEFQ